MATTDERAAVADALWDARRDRTTTAPPSERFAPFALADGYAVGAQLHARRVLAGERRAGVKIGFTNTAVWAALGLAEPICAVMYERGIHDGGGVEAVVVDTGSFVAPALEPEIVVGIGADGVRWWALGFEIVDCHYPEWRMTPADALADGGLHGLLVVGSRVELHPGADALREPFGIALLRNGAIYESGTTAAVLGGPLHALERAIAICARTPELSPPQPGELVTTGSLTSAPRIAPSETWTVSADGVAEPLRIVVR